MLNHKTITFSQRLAGSLLAIALVFSTVANTAEKIKKEPVKVIYVVDGDTLKVFFQDKKDTIRLIGIDTPESKKNKRAKKQSIKEKKDLDTIIKMGLQAKKYVQSLVKKDDILYIEFDVEPRDRYKRLLGYVYFADGTMLNLKLVQDGYAQPYTYPPNVKYKDQFIQAAREARENKRGLWADPK